MSPGNTLKLSKQQAVITNMDFQELHEIEEDK